MQYNVFVVMQVKLKALTDFCHTTIHKGGRRSPGGGGQLLCPLSPAIS